MLISIDVESRLTIPAHSSLQISLDDSSPVQSLIDSFCESMGMRVESGYELVTLHGESLFATKSIESSGLRNGDRIIMEHASAGNTNPNLEIANWYFVPILALFFGIAGIAICVSVYVLLRDTPDSYAIVFDAGSTHTDTILFKWPGPKLNNTGLVTEVLACHAQGGIANVPAFGSNISDYMSKCLTDTRKKIHRDSSQYTEVFFGATAGMRLLLETRPSSANKTLEHVREFLHNSKLEFEDSQAQIISGVVEGINGWITVNYLSRRLQSQKREMTKGALDLGGASTQVAFEVTESVGKSNPHVQTVKLYGKHYHVFCKSFLCYGTVEAQTRYKSYLFKEHLRSNSAVRNISSPCDPIGWEAEITLSSIMDSPCAPESVRVLHQISGGRLNETVIFVGTSDFQSCQKAIRYILSPRYCSDMEIRTEKCLDATDIPGNFHRNNFTGFSGFAYAKQNLKLNKNASRDEYMAKTKRHCNSSMSDIRTSVGESKVKELRNQQELCFKAIFVITLLSEVYQFDSNDLWSNIEFENTVENKTLGWALGYMVNATESISTAPAIPSMDTLAFSILVVVFCICIFIGIMLCASIYKSRRPVNLKRVDPRIESMSNC